MDRRTFLEKTIGASVAIGTYFAIGHPNNLSSSPLPYDLIAIKGGEPEILFDKGIEALGGIQSFVKKGQKVVIKPNIGWDVPPNRAGNTHPKLIKRIIEHCKIAGAKEIYVVDHTCDEWQRCYSNSGIERAVKDAGGKMAPGNSESYYHDIKIPMGKSLTSCKEHELILGADVFINVPILKSHSGTSLTIAMKNLMGNVWDRRYWHKNDLHQCIADFATFRKPTLNIVDAYNVMKTNGPKGVSIEDVVTMKAQLISTDIVAIDAAAAKLFGLKPEDIEYIQIASDMKIGRKDLGKLNIKRINV
ncbi:MAG: tat (twin-arginine translocation) pathway signal sequence [Chlorobiaceae bacterium]|nr:tat (twin-arginine translocation) pathway signal sequence [Chlorobiaceae bacterium]